LRRLLTLSAVAAAAALSSPALAQTGGGQPPPTTGPVAPAPPPAPAPKLEVQAPEKRTLIREGQDGRYLLGGRWYFRLDDAFVGDAQRYFAQDSLDGWTATTVPNDWNAGDLTLNHSSVGWYRKEFKLPKVPRGHRFAWKIRFQSMNFRAVAWLNGKKIGGVVNGYFPAELDLPGVRKGRNTLVVKVSSLRSSTDLTHWRAAAVNGFGTGGWWNFGGISREVYLRRMEQVDVESVQALPHLRKLSGPARVDVHMRLRNLTRKKRNVQLALAVRGPGLSERIVPDAQGVGGRGARRDFNTSFEIPHPRLWQPGRPALYSLAVSAGIDGKRLARYRLSFGVKKIQRGRNGALLLNGHKLNLRGASLHEDDPVTGAALSPRQRNTLVRRLRELGATVTRSHYPLHPAFLEAFDRLGIMVWSQAPVYQWPNKFFDKPKLRAAAISANERTVLNNANHASIFVWSIGNELGGNRNERGQIGSGLATYINEAARAVRAIDDTRMVGIDRQSRLGEPIFNRALAGLDVLGVNEYFGWYDSVSIPRGPTTTEELPGYLDAVHKAYPRTPLVITEYGAEASRSGPVTQRGTYEFQTDFMRKHLAIHASKRYVNGSIAWALKDFRVTPEWLGGAPAAYGTPPWHNKSLIEETGAPKPVFGAMKRAWRRTKPLR
jgi:beta-glucuronidase